MTDSLQTALAVLSPFLTISTIWFIGHRAFGQT